MSEENRFTFRSDCNDCNDLEYTGEGTMDITIEAANLVIKQRDRLAELEKQTQWQPIKTAPIDADGNSIDDKSVLLFKPNERCFYSYTCIGYCKEGVWKSNGQILGFHSRLAGKDQGYPTHWMPLPQPPLTDN